MRTRYPLLEDSPVRTPRSILVPLAPGVPLSAVAEAVDGGIARLGGRAFVRLGVASSKVKLHVPLTSAAEAFANLQASERTAAIETALPMSAAVPRA